jgi:hypothetical protein
MELQDALREQEKLTIITPATKHINPSHAAYTTA